MVVGQLTIETDVAVLGGGPAGYVAAIRAASLGFNVTLIEKRDRLGGVCLLEGCIPSKCLIHAVRHIDSARDAERVGIKFAEPEIELEKLRNWMGSVVDGLSKGVDSLLKSHKIEVVRGHGHFTGNKKISVEEADVFIEFKWAIVAVGAKDRPVPDSYPEGTWSSADALALTEIPNRLLVISDQYYGFEIAQVYAGLGSKVTIAGFDPENLFEADRDLVDVMMRAASKKMEIIPGYEKMESLTKIDAGYSAKFRDKAPDQAKEFDRVLVASGRKPNTENAGLETTKVVLDKDGFIEVDWQNRTSEPHIFAAGDVTGGPMYAFTAARGGKVAAEVIAKKSSAMDNRAVPAVVFTNPEIAWTGFTERSIQSSGKSYKTAKFPLRALGEAHVEGQTEGFTKVIYEPKNQQILGVGIVGPGASEMISEGSLAIEMGATLEDLAATLHPHPTMAESLMEAVELAGGMPIHTFVKGIAEKK
jgi:dihydrolipoamide dehydrogenase